MNRRFVDPDHHTVNRMGTWHVGYSGQYFTRGGSVQRVVWGNPLGPEIQEWVTRSPNGQEVQLGRFPTLSGYGAKYGRWNRL